MKYCRRCLMPDTRPGIRFDDHGVCYPCLNYDMAKKTDWKSRWHQLEILCDKFRGCNGNGYDCAIAVSGGKDSHFQTYILKEKLKMNPVLLSAGNVEWTETGKKNIENISDAFGVDLIMMNPNRNLARKMMIKSLEKIGSPSWYVDALAYAFPVKMAMKLGIKLLVYGEDVNYTYGGQHFHETNSALLQSQNDVVKPEWDIWFKDGDISEKELDAAKQPDLDEVKKNGLQSIYLSYYLLWNSHHNYEVAERWGFQHIDHEHVRENFIENYNQVDSHSYLLNPYIKYLKYGHSIATDDASRWIRYGKKTREEMIPFVEERDGKLDIAIAEKFCQFTRISRSRLSQLLDRWYNPQLFEQDDDGVWHPKFRVGIGLKT
jgi:N-acetyl sugar amidotransferase